MMLEQMKRIAKQTGEAETPTRFLFGTVTKLSPLTVLVDNRFYLSGAALILLRELEGHRHKLPAHQTEEAAMHRHQVEERESRLAEELAVGERVVLLRNQGGQEYLILGRV